MWIRQTQEWQMEFQHGTALPSPSDARIAWFEKTYRVSLPSEYVRALMTGNGATPLSNTFAQSGRERLIERMLCLLEKPSLDQANGWADITVVISQLDSRLIDDEELIGMNVIPIAALFGGDFLCLDYRANLRSPSVAVWDHDLSEDFQPVLDAVETTFAQFERILST